MRSPCLPLAVCALLSCHTARHGAATNPTSADLRLHDIWALQTFDGLSLRTENLQRGVPTLELHVKDGRVMGFGGCNQFNGPAIFERDTIRFGALVATRMACADVGGEVEYTLFEMLKGAVGYRLDGLKLTLAGKGGVAVFKKVD